MKKLIALAAILAVAGTAYADDSSGDGKFSHEAEYRVRYQYDQNITGDEKNTPPSSQDEIAHRFKFGTTFKSSEKLSATLTLLHNAKWGAEYNATNTDASGNSGLGKNDGAGDAENMLLVNEAYGTWVVSDEMNFKIGRGSGGLADGNLIGENDWEATPFSYEGVLGTYEHEAFQLQFWGVRFREYFDTSATSNQDDDAEVNSIGLAFEFKSLPEFLNLVNIHAIYNDADATFAATTNAALATGKEETRYGVVVGGETAGVDYKVNYESHSGKTKTPVTGGSVTNTDREGMMYQAELGYSMPEMMNSRFYVLYHSDSGDGNTGDTKFETYDPYFYEMHTNAGLMDVVKWGNLTYISLGYTLEPMEDTMVGIHYHMFSRTENKFGVDAGGNGSKLGLGSTITASGTNTKDKIGDEIDLVASKKYDGGIVINTRLGMFMPGDYLKDSTIDKKDTYTQVFVEGVMSF